MQGHGLAFVDDVKGMFSLEVDFFGLCMVSLAEVIDPNLSFRAKRCKKCKSVSRMHTKFHVLWWAL